MSNKDRRSNSQNRRGAAEQQIRPSQNQTGTSIEKAPNTNFSNHRRLARIRSSMDRNQKKLLLENLYVALAIAFVTVIICGFAYLVELRDTAREREAIRKAGNVAAVSDIPLGASDRAFRHVYPVKLARGDGFGAILNLGEYGFAARAAVIMDSNGTLLAAAPLDSSRPDLPFGSASWFGVFKGFGSKDRPFAVAPASLQPDESDSGPMLIETAGALERLSRYIRTHVMEE